MANNINKFLDKAGLTRLISWIKDALNSKQATLVSGTNLKTINNESLLGSGNISIQGGGGSVSITYEAKGTNIPGRLIINT